MAYLTASEARAEALVIVVNILLRSRLSEEDLERLKDDAHTTAKKIGVKSIREELEYLFSTQLP